MPPTREIWQSVAVIYGKVQKEEDPKIPRVGRTIRVISGRKIPIGTVANVVWFGENKFYRESRYGNYYFGPNPFGFYIPEKYNIAIILDGKRIFTSAKNVQVIET